MHTVTVAAVVLCLLAAPSLGVINIKLTSDSTYLGWGETTTIRIWAQGTEAGVYSLGGSVVASGPTSLTAVPGSFRWASQFNPSHLLHPASGKPGLYGGWADFGSMQTNFLAPDPNLGKADYVEVASYVVYWAGWEGFGYLSFQPHTVSGYKPVETNRTTTIVNITGVPVYIVPEPVTAALLTLGAFLVAWRRR
jgi:hypothetical protein